MSVERIYKCNLRGIQVDDYKQNPIVCRDWTYDPASVVGKAEVMPGKTSIRVTFRADVPEYEHRLETATIYLDGDVPILAGLALIPGSQVLSGKYHKVEPYAQWWNLEVTLYRGDEIVDFGTVKELAERRGVHKRTIYWLTMPTAQRRAASRKDPSKALVGVVS